MASLCLLTLLFLSTAAVVLTKGSTFNVDFRWNFINFTWPDAKVYQSAIDGKKYIPENVAMAGIKIYQDDLYIAIPRIRKGVPATLGRISMKSAPKHNALISPYPNWNMNQQSNCRNLQSVQSMEIDRNGTMWVLDGVRINNNTQCPPKLLLLDINAGGKILETFIFPDHICLERGGFLNDIVVDDSDGDYAYITDDGAVDPGLIVYSRRKHRAWKLRDRSMFPEISAANYIVDGVKFDQLTPIDGIALSPRRKGSRTVFYCSLTGFDLYGISTEILKNEELCLGGNWRDRVLFIGRKQAQSDGMVVDCKGDLYYGLLPLYGVGRWNIKKPFSTAEIVDQNKTTMIWNDSFAFDQHGFLYLLANNIHKYFNPNYPIQITNDNFRILKLYTATNSYLW